MGKIAKYKDSKNIYFYIKDSGGQVVDYGILTKGLQVETGQPVLESKQNSNLFNDIFKTGWTIENGDIIGTLKEGL